MIGIYKFTNKYSRKSYIGKSENIETRKKVHIRKAANNEKGYFYNAIRKYGIDSFDFDVLIECPKELLSYWEQFYIKYYGSNLHDYGYNCTNGGDGVTSDSWTQEMRDRQSQIHTELNKSPERIEKLSKAAIERFKRPEEREKVRQEQYRRLEDPDYREFLHEIGKNSAVKRWENWNNKTEEEKKKWSDEHSARMIKIFSERTPERKEELREINRQAQLKYWSTHEGAIKGKHKVWDDDTHTKYHYE